MLRGGGRVATKERGWRERASEMKNACWFIQQAFFIIILIILRGR